MKCVKVTSYSVPHIIKQFNCLQNCRYTVKMLLNHEFFVEGVKIELLPQPGGETSPLLHLRMEVPIKETSKKNNQESIEFTYNIDKDVPEVVVAKMVRICT